MAGGDIIAEVGQTIKLDASKSEGANSYKWYLGDGSVKEGVMVDQIYQFPGTYLITLEVGNGNEIALDQIKVYIFGGKAIINEVFAGLASTSPAWVEIFNPTSVTLDLSGWVLESGNKTFTEQPLTWW